ncbi:MAG: ATP-binding protein [Chloroflexi bacterium]|nr:ATP-binding protein [Chloroflexota bacterium]
MNEVIGYIVGGGLKEGFRIRLTVPAETVQEGSFIVCDSGRNRYYGLVTDLQLGATDPRFADEQPTRLQPAISQALLGKTLYTTLNVYATLMLDTGPALGTQERLEWEQRIDQGIENPGPKPVKTVPSHHAPVRTADAGDVAEIFGQEGKGMFVVGNTIEQGHPIRLDLNKFVKRSSGIFGATGTGKSFLTRMVLAGLMKENVASALVFDMHNEYSFDVQDSDKDGYVKGLKSLFGSRVQVVVLGKEQIRGQSSDLNMLIGYDKITEQDILLLSKILNLRETTPVVIGALVNSFGRNWFSEFMKLLPGKTEEIETDSGRIKKVPSPDSLEFWADKNNVHPAAASALHGKLITIFRKEYMVEHSPIETVNTLIDNLENGRHVIPSFGKYDNELDYLLVCNILTRRLRKHWVEKTEKAYIAGTSNPRALLIAIEEAHKLLSPEISHQTAFGTIARELRKYFITLLVIDQRPSGIDDEIMSQLGTRITGWLGDEDDIRAVLSGLAGREQLRGMLARLQEKQEVLLLGWGVKMPIPIRSRRYDDKFYAEINPRPGGLSDLTDAEINSDLGFG